MHGATLRSQDGMLALSLDKLEAVQVKELGDQDYYANWCQILSTKYCAIVMFSGQSVIVGKFVNKEDAVDVMNNILNCCREDMDYQVPEDLSDKEE